MAGRPWQIMLTKQRSFILAAMVAAYVGMVGFFNLLAAVF
jgi:hypothetical protein